MCGSEQHRLDGGRHLKGYCSSSSQRKGPELGCLQQSWKVRDGGCISQYLSVARENNNSIGLNNNRDSLITSMKIPEAKSTSDKTDSNRSSDVSKDPFFPLYLSHLLFIVWLHLRFDCGNSGISSSYRRMTSITPYLTPYRQTVKLLHIRSPANIALYLTGFDCVGFMQNQPKWPWNISQSEPIPGIGSKLFPHKSYEWKEETSGPGQVAQGVRASSRHAKVVGPYTHRKWPMNA